MTYRPLFIFGLARSGTNLVARMLDHHPAVAVALDPFLPLFRSLRNATVSAHASQEVRQRFNPASPFQDYYFDDDGPALLNLMLAARADLPLDGETLVTLRYKTAERATLESSVLGKRMERLEGVNYGCLLRSGLDIVAGTKPAAIWAGCKEVWVLEFIPMLVRLFPDARFLAVERDPRAIVSSLLAMATQYPTQAAHAPSYLRHWRKQVALTRRFELDPALAERFRSISFERLATEPEIEARRLCDELGIDFKPEMLRLSADGWKGNSSYNHGGSDIYSDTVDRWRQILPKPLAQVADFLCGPEMALTPYHPVGEVKLDIVLAYLIEAGLKPGSWRSDSGDLLTDFGGELVRHALLETSEVPVEGLAERCFLFADTLGAIRQAR